MNAGESWKKIISEDDILESRGGALKYGIGQTDAPGNWAASPEVAAREREWPNTERGRERVRVSQGEGASA